MCVLTVSSTYLLTWTPCCMSTVCLTSGSGVTSSSSSLLGAPTNGKKWKHKHTLNKCFSASTIARVVKHGPTVKLWLSFQSRQPPYLLHQTFIRLLRPFDNKGPTDKIFNSALSTRCATQLILSSSCFCPCLLWPSSHSADWFSFFFFGLTQAPKEVSWALELI